MPSEKSISEAIAKLCRKRGAYSFKVHGSVAMRRGLPDRAVCYRGRYIAIEEKQPGKKPTPLQQHELDQVLAAGGTAVVASSADHVAAVFDAIDALIDGVEDWGGRVIDGPV
jgi:hypothetical protein